jgi:hypothetical protein
VRRLSVRKVRATRQKVEISMTNLLFAILIGVGGGTTAVGIVPQAPTAQISEASGRQLALPCHEDEIPVVMPHDWVPSDGDRWIADQGIDFADGEVLYNRLCIPQDDYDEALIDAYIDSH